MDATAARGREDPDVRDAHRRAAALRHERAVDHREAHDGRGPAADGASPQRSGAGRRGGATWLEKLAADRFATAGDFAAALSGTRPVAIPAPRGARIRVSVNGGAEPLWSHSGSTVFYRSRTGIFAAEISGSPLRVVRRDSLFNDPFLTARNGGQNWAVFPNDKEFVFIRQPQAAATSGFVVINWPQLSVTRVGGGAER